MKPENPTPEETAGTDGGPAQLIDLTEGASARPGTLATATKVDHLDSTAAPRVVMPAWDRWFEMSARRSTMGREVRGGLVTFFTMAYIVVLNPLIVGTAQDINGNYITGGTDVVASIAMVSAATALVAGIMTVVMGLWGRFPLAVAAGLGLNGFVAFTLAPQMTWPDVMGLIVLEGLIILLLVLTGLRTAVFNAIPEPLKYAIGVGIGLFIALIGLVDAGIVRPGVPLITFGVNGTLQGWPTAVFVFGLLLMAILLVRKVKGALLIGILVTTLAAVAVEAIVQVGPLNDGNPDTPNNPTGWALNVPALPEKILGVPDLSALGNFSLLGAFTAIGAVAALLAVFSLLLSDFFDTMGTVFGLADEAELIDSDGQIPHLQSILVVDSLAAVAGGAAGTSSNTSYIESASGIGEGARTGIASLVTGALFLIAVFVSPLVSVIPYEAATPALVIVGFLMMTQIRRIPFDRYEVGIPAFLTIVVMPFTYSITNGIGAGMVSYVVLQVALGRARSVNPLLWIIAAAFTLYFAIAPISGLLGL